MSLMNVHIRFDKKLRDWDGFGFNYVETAQTQDYAIDPQDYGGFSMLTEEQRQTILDLIFGEDGLQPGVIKMFNDPWHQPQPEAPGDESLEVKMERYDHKTTTQWMRYFARNGLRISRKRGQDLQVITTLYGPPGWMTRQRSLSGRDMDPHFIYTLARYLVSWAKYLLESEGIPVRYISLHNEGEDYVRWRDDGTSEWSGHDYNLYWPPEQVCDFLRFCRAVLDANGLMGVSLTPGECSNWFRFYEWGYADSIAEDPIALANLGLITSHGFSCLDLNRWFADWRSPGIDLLREKRYAQDGRELHAWVTSTSWSKMDVFMLNEMRNNIYAAKVNAIIPWAGIQRSILWKNSDPNPGTAFRVLEDGSYQVEPGYYYYKQLSRAGQPGMGVARVSSNDTHVCPIAFSSNGTRNGDNFVLLNLSDEVKQPEVVLTGNKASGFQIYRTSPSESYCSLGQLSAPEQSFAIELPQLSVTTFFGEG
jgi:O-glycosyl hydrolase